MHISRGWTGICQHGAFSGIAVIVASFVPAECPKGGGYVGYIRKALEKGYLEHPGSACCTDSMFEIFVFFGQCLCCLLAVFVNRQPPCPDTNSRRVERLLTDLSAWGSQIGIQFNPNKTEVYHFHRPRSSGATSGGAQQAKHIWWGQHRLDFKDPMFTYLGHTIAGVGYRGKARDALFAALQAQVAAYTILPLTSFERAQIVNSVLIPRWVYKSLFMWDVCWGNRMETAFEEFVLQAPRVEKYLQYRLYTDVTEGGLGLHSASWAGLCALIQLVQRALRVPHRPMTRRTNSGHLPHMVEKYRKSCCPLVWKWGASHAPANR